MMTIDEMEKELKEAGYTGDWLYAGIGQAFTFTFGDGLEVYDASKDDAIAKAYAHLQREKQFQAMREFLSEMAATDFTGTDMRINGAAQWREKAKRLLATLPDSD